MTIYKCFSGLPGLGFASQKIGLLGEVTIYKCFSGLPGLGFASQKMADLASPGQSLDKAETTLVIGCDNTLCGD